MQNISVGKKIWLNLLLLIVLLVGTGGALVYYLSRVHDQVVDEVRVYDDRILMTARWRAASELAISHIVAANMTLEEGVAAQLLAKSGEYSKQSAEILKTMQEQLTNERSVRQLEAIVAARGKVVEANQRLSALRKDGSFVQAQKLLEQEVLPAAAGLLQAQNDLVKLGEELRDVVVREAADRYNMAAVSGAVAAAVAILLGLLFARRVVLQVTQPLDSAVQLAESIAKGDLTRDVHDERRDELGHLLRSLGSMARKLREVVGEVRNGVDSVSSAAGQIASGNQDLSSRTEQSAASLEQTAASTEQLTATVTQAAETAQQANRLAGTAIEAAEQGGEVVRQMVSSMALINSSSRKISDIIGVIDGIAFQTNILALNAAVEAARAGEQGRGFAVVAAEVRSLAGRSAEAAKEIKSLIGASVQSVDAGSAQVAQAGESMQKIVGSVRRVTDLIAEITASATEQRDGIAQVNQAVGNLDQMTQQNAALVEQSSAAAAAMSEQAQRLAEVVSVFNVGRTGLAPVSRPADTPPRQAATAPPRKVPAGIASSTRAPAPRLAAAATVPAPPATAPAEGNWESF